jgi:hypothetical protein
LEWNGMAEMLAFIWIRKIEEKVFPKTDMHKKIK